MQADARTIVDLLSCAPFFETPFLQRRYRWRPERNWSPFADAVLRSAAALDTTPEPEASLNFIGAMVFQTRTDGGLDILDGQQRLITVSAGVRALISLCRIMNETAMETRLMTLLRAGPATRSDFRGARGAVAARGSGLRIRPSTADAQDLSKALGSGPSDPDLKATEQDREVPETAAIQCAALYLRARFGAFLRDGSDLHRLRLLEQALLERTQAVAIQLSPKTDAFTVFEQLNNLGERLSKLDLIKNKLFSAARADGVELDALKDVYASRWRVFDAPENLDFWGGADARGDGARGQPRPDAFLRAFLSGFDGQPTPYGELEARISRHLAAKDARPLELIERLAAAAEGFMEVCDRRSAARHADQIRALRLFGAAVADPLLLAMRQHLWRDTDAVERLLNAIEAVLVRRYVCDETGGFDVFSGAAGLVKPGADARGPEVVEAVIAYLARRARAAFWPSDAVFEDAWVRKVAYHPRRGDKKKIYHHILERIDAKMRLDAAAARGSEPPARAPEWDLVWSEDPEGLTIEHLWPPGGARAQGWPALRDIDRIKLHSFGNLLPVTFEVNQELGRKSWERKRAILAQCETELARDLLATPEWRDAWTLEAIDARARRLFEHARVIWPAMR